MPVATAPSSRSHDLGLGGRDVTTTQERLCVLTRMTIAVARSPEPDVQLRSAPGAPRPSQYGANVPSAGIARVR